MSLILLRLPDQMRAAMSPVLLAAVMSTVSVPLVLVRGQTRPPVPVPLFLGVGPAQWVRAQIGASAVLFTVTAAVPVAVLTVLEVSAWTVLTIGVPYRVLASDG
jgi:hypothetical protein